MLKIWKWQSHSTCPRCNLVEETNDHVLQYHMPSAIAALDKEIIGLSKWLVSSHVTPGMDTVIIQRLQE